MARRIEFDLDHIESAMIDEDTQKILLQLEAWFDARVDHLREVATSDIDSIQAGELVLSTDEEITAWRLGVQTALQAFDKLPIRFGTE